MNDQAPTVNSDRDAITDANLISATGDEVPVLFVDLDGTLIRTDLLHEALVQSAVRRPLKTLWLLPRLLEGRAEFKHALARHWTLQVPTLPFRQEILDFIQEQHSRGRTIVLATGSCREWAQCVSSYLKLFDHVLASDEHCNLKGPEKLATIREFCRLHGFTRFGYIGDSRSDLPIWEHASEIYLAANDTRLLKALERMGVPIRVFDGGSSPVAAVFRVLRPHQCAKNTLLFVPLILSHRIGEIDLLFRALTAFISFSLFASGVYVLNDFVDIEFDRRHYRKRNRPFASGELSLVTAIPLSGIVFVLGGVLAYSFLPVSYAAVLVTYLIFTTAYSLVIKRMLIGDVMVLAGLYALRIFAGGIACDIAISDWLLTFSLFIFVSLGFLKRYVELTRMNDTGVSVCAGRGYEAGDMHLVETMGISCGMMSVVVLTLYLQSEQVRFIYRSSRMLWLLCPILMYWLCRAWALARRRRITDDPIAFALTDGTSLVIVAVTLSLLAVTSIVG